jgi:type II restriction enzyme
VRKAVAGIEVRSSAFLIEHYEAAIALQKEQTIAEALRLKEEIISEHEEILSSDSRRATYLSILREITPETIHAISFKVPGWHSTQELSLVNEKLKHLKECITKLQKRDFLSITPKVEDIKIVYKWIESFNVPHYYFQVFFDKIYGISFEEILKLISSPEQEGEVYSIESDVKNQNKTTIKIPSQDGVCLAQAVTEPDHHSVRKELNKGRLLFYVKFDGGEAFLDKQTFDSLFDCNL